MLKHGNCLVESSPRCTAAGDDRYRLDEIIHNTPVYFFNRIKGRVRGCIYGMAKNIARFFGLLADSIAQHFPLALNNDPQSNPCWHT